VNPLNPLYYAVAWVIMRLHAGLGALFGPASGLAWALSIVFLVVLMRLLLLPLFIKQMHATRKMTALAPQVAELRKKYKGNKQKLNEETMKLYKDNGANPLAGCLPVAAQLPVFFALFGVLRAISEDEPKYGLTPAVVASAQKAQIFGVTMADRLFSSIHPPTLFPLSAAGRLVIIITVLISATTTFLTVRQSTKRGMTPQMTPDNPMASSQKYMAYIVPVFALSGLYWQFGLVLYWVTTNVWTLGQQHVLFKRFPPLPTAATGAAATPAVGTGKTPGQAPAKAPGAKAPGVKAPGAKAPAVKAPGKASGGSSQAGKPANGQPGKTPGGTAPTGGAAKGAPPSANGGGGLRRLVKGRSEAEPEPPQPETKLVRQQRVRQSRSRRSGKR
jgi:YidC/Oxa1 family membrane protein insertase